MKKTNISWKLIILMAFIIVVLITTAVTIFTKESKADSVAKVVLTKAYGSTLEDYENLTNTLNQNLGDNEILLDYMHTMYGELLTENGCKIFVNNRITSAFTAHEQNSNLRVLSIKLEPEDAIEGSKNYAFTIQVQTEKDAYSSFTFKGHIRLVKENGKWKVDSVSPVY